MKSNTERIQLIDIYPYRKQPNGIEFLLLKRSQSSIYSGQWRMVGGKLKTDESAIDASIRELKEETGFSPILFWCVPSYNIFFDFKHDCFHQIPVFSAEIDAGVNPVLNHEHDSFGWFQVDDAIKCVSWPEQKRLVSLINGLVEQNLIINDWIIEF